MEQKLRKRNLLQYKFLNSSGQARNTVAGERGSTPADAPAIFERLRIDGVASSKVVTELRSVASPVLKISGSRLQIRKVQFLQILYVAQSQPQDSLKRSNQLYLALNLTFDLTFPVCCVERPSLISNDRSMASVVRAART